MKTLHAQIIEKFLERIGTSKHLDDVKRERLRKLLKEAKKLNADDFMKVFAHEEEDVQ